MRDKGVTTNVVQEVTRKPRMLSSDYLDVERAAARWVELTEIDTLPGAQLQLYDDLVQLYVTIVQLTSHNNALDENTYWIKQTNDSWSWSKNRAIVL